MAVTRIRARSVSSACRKAKSKNMTIGKVSYIKGSKKGGLGSYAIWKHKRKK